MASGTLSATTIQKWDNIDLMGRALDSPTSPADCTLVPPDSDNDGVCDEDEVADVKMLLACNFDPTNTDAADICEYCSCAQGCLRSHLFHCVQLVA